MTSRSAFFRLTALAAFLILSALFETSAHAAQNKPPAKTVAIDIDNFKFGVVSIEVAAGTTVTWTNRDDVPHTVASSTKVFKSPPLDTGEAFSYTFTQPGTYEYFCSLHPRMTGKIVVK